jgi:hypothetical protein
MNWLQPQADLSTPSWAWVLNVYVYMVKRNQGSIFAPTLRHLVLTSLSRRHISSSMSKDSSCKVQFYGTWVRCSHRRCSSRMSSLGPEILILHCALLQTGSFHPTDVVFNPPLNWQLHISEIVWWTNSPSFENNWRFTRFGLLSPLQCFSVYLPSSSEVTLYCAPSAVLRRRSSQRPGMQSPAVHLYPASLAVGCWRPATAWLSQPSASIYAPLHHLHL